MGVGLLVIEVLHAKGKCTNRVLAGFRIEKQLGSKILSFHCLTGAKTGRFLTGAKRGGVW